MSWMYPNQYVQLDLLSVSRGWTLGLPGRMASWVLAGPVISAASILLTDSPPSIDQPVWLSLLTAPH